MKIKIRKDRVGAVSLGLTDTSKNSPFVKGNKYAAAENMSPESHARRMAGLMKTWAVLQRKDRNERTAMPVRKQVLKKKKERIRLRETLIREHREIQDMARRNTEAAMRKCVDLMHDPKATPMVQLAAANAVLERAYGKPNQTNTNVNFDANGKENEVSSTELDQRIAQTLRRVEEIAGRAPKKKPRTRLTPDVRLGNGNTGGESIH
jgi:hypothetical protein